MIHETGSDDSDDGAVLHVSCLFESGETYWPNMDYTAKTFHHH